MIHKLMLLPQQPLRVEDLRSNTLYCVQPKYDGIRCAFDIATKLPYTRTGKNIPNAWLRHALKDTYEVSPWNGLALDGELQLWNPVTRWWDPYDAVQSFVMSKREPSLYEKQAWRYIIFDNVGSDLPFSKRIDYIKWQGGSFNNRFQVTAHSTGDKEATIVMCKYMVDDLGYEGAIVRRVDAPYKPGRATYNEHIIFKYVEWLRAEATVVGVEELYANVDTSCKKLDNMMPMDTLGSLVVESKEFGRFSIGSGFTTMQRADLWKRRKELEGQLVTYKYRPGHLKDKPCPAIFVGLRSKEDL